MRVGHKPGEGPVTEADYAADETLHERLMPLIPGAHWLSEESEQSEPSDQASDVPPTRHQN